LALSQGAKPAILFPGIVGLLLFLLPALAKEEPSSSTAPAAATSESLRLTDAISADWVQRTWKENREPERLFYEGTGLLDGTPGVFSAELTTARVLLNRDYYTRAEWPHGDKPLLPALEFQWRGSTRAERGPASSMSYILYVNHDNPLRALKTTYAQQDSRGTFFQQFQFWKNPPRRVYHSWRDGEGDGERILPWNAAEALVEEQLFMLVRAIQPMPDGRYSCALLPTAMTDRASEPVVFDAELSVMPATPSAPRRHYRLLRSDGFSADYFIEAVFPHRLLEWKASDGRSLRLLTDHP
jgi:hypothetical protein